MIDESVAFAMAQTRPGARAGGVLGPAASALFVVWNVGTSSARSPGQVIGDTDAFGLDAAFPAVLLALVLPSLKDRAHPQRRAARRGVALATTPFLPAGVPVLLALVGLVVLIPAAEPKEEVAA